jgi:hypothetical protein
MDAPKIQALGVIQERTGTSWKATGYVENVGWLEARGKSLIEAMEVLQALAATRVAEGVQTSPVAPTTPGEQERGEPGVP